MKTFDIILLTAGKSSRMGQDKALLEINGRKVINIIIEKLLKAVNYWGASYGEKFIRIILGHHSKLIKKHIEKEFCDKVKFVYNENHELGMYSSIKKGASTLTGDNHFILQMIDQPFIEQKLYYKIIEEYDGKSPILQPSFQEKKGHPIIINKELIPLIKNDTKSNSLRDFLRPYYKDIQVVKYDKNTILQNLNNYESFKEALINN